MGREILQIRSRSHYKTTCFLVVNRSKTFSDQQEPTENSTGIKNSRG